MKVIEAIKYFRGGSRTYHIIVSQSEYDNAGSTDDERLENLEWLVDEKLDDDAGAAYGYKCDYDFLTDQEKINEVLLSEIDKVDAEINGVDNRVAYLEARKLILKESIK